MTVDIHAGTSVKNSVQCITRVVEQNSINCAGICALMSSCEGHVIRGLSCWFRNFIQVIHMRKTVAKLMLNLCAKSCSSSPKRS